LYAAFRAAFPDLNVNVIDEEQMKSKEGKAKWRAFLDGFVKRYVYAITSRDRFPQVSTLDPCWNRAELELRFLFAVRMTSTLVLC